MRHILLASALLLSAGIVFAGSGPAPAVQESVNTPATPVAQAKSTSTAFKINDLTNDDKQVTGYDWVVPGYAGWAPNSEDYPKFDMATRKASPYEKADRTWGDLKANTKQNGGYYNLSATVVRYDDSTEWSYTAYDVNDPTKQWELTAENALSVDSVFEYENKFDEELDKTVSKETENLLRKVYHFAIPVGEYTLQTSNKTDDDGNPIYKTDEDGNPIEDEDGNPVPETVTRLIAPVTEIAVKSSAGKDSINDISQELEAEMFYKVNSQFLAYGVAAGTDADGNPIVKKDAEIAFGQPLPTPVATLLIALGFGAAFMMYRNRKQVKA